MDLTSLPPEYFNTKEFFRTRDRKLKDKGYVVDRNGRPIRRKKMKRSYSVPYILGLSISLIILVVLIVLLALVFFDVIHWGKELLCVPGFDEGTCERSDFLDTYVWSAKRLYDVNGEQCKSGVAFRTYAPDAKKVQVVIRNLTSLITYDMIRQVDGCWFVNLCNIGVGNSYSFSITSSKGIDVCSRLSLGSSFVQHYGTSDQMNIITSTITTSKQTKMNLNEAVIYQIYLPSFVSKDDSESYFSQLRSKLPYLVSLGINTIQLFPVERINCDNVVGNCWNFTSIQYPGILHPHYGSMDEFRELVSLCHEVGIRVLLEVNWVFADKTSMFYDYECDATWGPYFSTFYAATVFENHKLGFSSLKQTRNYIWKILSKWRNEIGIDGVVWQYSNCLFYSGSSCLMNIGSIDGDAVRMIRQFVEDSDYLHIGDVPNEYSSSLFDSVYTPSLTNELQSILLTSPLSVTDMKQFLLSFSSSSSQSIFCFETRSSSLIRFTSHTESHSNPELLRLQSIGLVISFISPSIPCLFMGTESYSTIPFTNHPESMSWRVLNEFSDEYHLSLLSRALIHLHKQYSLQASQLNIEWENTSKGILCYSLQTPSSFLLILLNLSKQSIELSELFIPVPSVPNKSSWKVVFNSESSDYSSFFENENEIVHSLDCQNEVGKCISLSIHWLAARVLLAV